MKMHLINILNSLDADNSEKKILFEYFKKHKVSFRKAENALTKLRGNELNI